MAETNEICVMNAHCNTCGGGRNHEILKKIKKSKSEHLGEFCSIYWDDLYYVLECRGCESIKMLHESSFSEETDEQGVPIVNSVYYPSSIFRQHPRWLAFLDNEWHVTKLLREIYQAIQNDAPGLAAMGIRAVIEFVMIDKVRDQGSFKKNLDEFQKRGFISAFKLGILESALELGHASIHREFIPTFEQLEIAMDITESLVQELYVLEHQAKASVKHIPKRNV